VLHYIANDIKRDKTTPDLNSRVKIDGHFSAEFLVRATPLLSNFGLRG
jgi:hypothetical protein